MRHANPYRSRGGRAAHWAVAALAVMYWSGPPLRERPAPPAPRPAPATIAPLAHVEAGVAFLQHPHPLEVEELQGVFQAGTHRYAVTRAGVLQVGDAVGRYTVRGIREDAILLDDGASTYLLELASGACIAHSARLEEPGSPRW